MNSRLLSNRSFRCAFAAILCVVSINTSAQNVIAIKAGRIIDGTGAPSIKNGVVIVRGNRIEAVGPQSSVRIPNSAKVIDLPGETLLPGLIDGHNHLSIRYGITLDSGTPKQVPLHDGRLA